MTKTKQWILSVIFAAVLVSALFFGIMLSDPVYITARAEEISTHDLESISLNGITVNPNYVSQGMTWDFGNTSSDDTDNVWRLNKQFKQYCADLRNNTPDWTRDEEFYQCATISEVERVDNPPTTISETGAAVQAGTHSVTVALAENSKYQFAEGVSSTKFMLQLENQEAIDLNGVTLSMALTQGDRWSFENVLTALRVDKFLGGAADTDKQFLSADGFYEGLSIVSISGGMSGTISDGQTQMQVGVYQVKLALPQDGLYAWDTDVANADTFSLTVYENISLQGLSVEIGYDETLYWQAEQAVEGCNYVTPSSVEFQQGIANVPESIQHLTNNGILNNLKIAAIANDSGSVNLGTAVKAGHYTVTLDFADQNGLYRWADDSAGQIGLEIVKKKLSLVSYENMRWALSDGSELSSDTLYQYSYTTADNSETKNYYSLTQLTYAPDSDWNDWAFVGQIQTNRSVARYTGTTVQIQLVFGGLGTIEGMSYIPNNDSSSQVGKQKASAKVTLRNDCNYTFDTAITPSDIYNLQNRGVEIVFSEDGQSVTVTKEWYIAASHNVILDSSSVGNQLEFTVPGWTFGQDPHVAAPRLAHGDYAYTATLINLDTNAIIYNIDYNTWAAYFNSFMPAARYQLILDVQDVTVSEAHQDWWNKASCDIINVTFLGQSTSYFFTVAKAQLDINESAVNAFGQNAADFNTKLVMGSGAIDYSQLFASVSKFIYGENAYLTKEDRVENGGYWASATQDSLFDDAPVYQFRILEVLGNQYYKATDSVWSSQITKVGSYTVLYKVTMKNYVTIGENDAYEHYFYVSLCKIITAQPVLAELSFNNQNQTPYLINSDNDRNYYEVAAGQSFKNIGTHDVQIAIKDEYKAFVMWSENDKTGITTVQLKINPVANYWRVSPRISNWNYGDAIPSPEAEAAYFNVANGDTKTFKYYKVDASGNLIDPDSADTRLERFAVNNGQIPIGRYALVTVIAVGSNGGYGGLSTQNGGYYIFEVRPASNYWVTAPFMADIVYGEYDPAINQPTATAYQYNPDMGDHIQFQFRKANGNVVDWQAPVVNLSKDTPIGRYALIATFIVGAGNQNYGAVNNGQATVSYFNILPTSNTLIVNPITTWQYGAYADEASTQTAKAKFFNAETDRFVYTYFEAERIGSAVVKKENAQAKTINELKVQGAVPAGLYILELQLVVEGDGSYSGISQDYAIEVTQSTNHWTEFPRIASWSVGDTPNNPQAKAAFGTANIVIRNSDNTVMYTTADGWINPCAAGYYTLEATVDGTRDYAGISTYRTEFRVFQASSNGTSVDKVVNGVNVKVEAAMVSGTEVKVTEIDANDQSYQNVKQALENRDMVVCGGYKVEFVLNGETVSNGRVTVTITLSDELKGKIGLSAYDANGIALGSVLNADGTITFSTNNPEGCYLAYSANSGSTDAGFIIALVAMVILIVGLVVVAIFVIKNAQKQKLEDDEDEEDYDEE